MVANEASDVKAASVPVCSKARDGMPDASRRLTDTELNIPETHKWHIRSAFGRRETIETFHGGSECVAYITAWRLADRE